MPNGDDSGANLVTVDNPGQRAGATHVENYQRHHLIAAQTNRSVIHLLQIAGSIPNPAAPASASPLSLSNTRRTMRSPTDAPLIGAFNLCCYFSSKVLRLHFDAFADFKANEPATAESGVSQ